MSAKSLPAYLRLPDGLRLAGSASIDKDGVLVFAPKQAMSPVPPSGLPVDLVVAGLPDDEDDEDGQVQLTGSIDIVNARQVGIVPDEPLPQTLREHLAPDLGDQTSYEEPLPEGPLGRMQREGLEVVSTSMRRFLIDLGDHLFDLATSARYGTSGRQIHYDALNQLKRSSKDVGQRFEEQLRRTLSEYEKDENEDEVADLSQASARSLDLVGLDEIDQQIAGDKIVNSLADRHRVELESLTIRSAKLHDIEPLRARTPFHPAHILRAFTDSLSEITDDADVTKDVIHFFGQTFAPQLDALYPTLNRSLIAADIEPDLEERIRETGSVLYPPEKRIIKSKGSDRPKANLEEESAPADGSVPAGAQQPGGSPGASSSGAGPGPRDPAGTATGQTDAASGHGVANERGEGNEGSAGNAKNIDVDDRDELAEDEAEDDGQPKTKHDAIYDAVIAALDSQRDRASRAAGDSAAAAGGSAEAASADGADAADGADVAGTEGVASSATSTDGVPEASAGPQARATPVQQLGQEEIVATLRQLQEAQPAAETSLANLPPLSSLLTAQQGGEVGTVELERDSANRLDFIDNVFRTLHTNFEVSKDMEPSIARLRVPLARLSLQEPRFFTQPEHPAHQLLDKLSTLASTDHTVNQRLQQKLEEIVDEVTESYDGDSEVFDDAQQKLDELLGQQDRVLDKSVQRVVSALEGQEKLGRAQRRVEKLLREKLDENATPAAIQELLDSGWRSALVQLAVREGEDSVAWREETALLESLSQDIQRSASGELPELEKREMKMRLRALNKRLAELNPGSIAHENALRSTTAILEGESKVETQAYRTPEEIVEPPAAEKVEQLPRLKRWMQRTEELEPGTRLRYVDKEGRRRQMELVFVSEDKNRFAFVNERGQKIAELSAVQLARQLSRGATPPTNVDKMSVLDQSMYNTLERAQRTLSFERNRDQLTRLINNDALMNQLNRTLRHAQRRGAEHAFSLLDIDNFGLVNEVFDETSGDEVLAEFAKLLSQLNDRRALTARLSEDEFGILMTYRSANEARELGEKIRNDIANSSLNVGGDPVSFTVSMGIAPVEQTTSGTDAVVSHARSALELAKSQGRDQVVVYNPDQQEIIEYKRDREASRARLDEAMSTDRLVLRAQPIVQTSVDGSASASHHYEVLLSMRDDDGNLLSPQDFITSAERFGFINLVDRWVVREVFTWISSLVDKQKVVPELSINLSGTSITDNDFLEQISEFGVGTSRLCFEITETGAIDNLPRAADFVRTLKNLGCKFSLDDFGTGLASHNYLRELPVDYVKIDGTFISNIQNSDTDYAMAKSINDLAHFLGQQTVAECVETLENIPALREIGVDFLQGWGIGMPRRLQEITEDLPALET